MKNTIQNLSGRFFSKRGMAIVLFMLLSLSLWGAGALPDNSLSGTVDSSARTENPVNALAVPSAVPVLTPEEALKANTEALSFHRKKENAKKVQAFFHAIGLNKNRIHFIIALLPLLLVIDVIPLKRKKDKKDSNRKVANYFSLSRRLRILLSVSLLAFGLLVFVPWSVYFGNSMQFSFIFQDFVNWNLRMLTVSIIGACIVLLLIPPVVSDYLVAAVTGLGLCVYIQAMFMNQYLGTMNGTELDLNENRVFGIVNIIIWGIVVLAPVVLKKLVPSHFSKIIVSAAGIVLFLEILATASMVLSASRNVWSRSNNYYADGTNQFQLSKEKNVIYFCFDTLGGGILKECFTQYPETKEVVKDFIWYEDARCNYQGTFPGLSHELTGAFLPVPALDYNDLFDKLWHSKSATSFYKQVADAGFDTRLYCSASWYLLGLQDNYQDYYSNIKPNDVSYEIDHVRLHSCLKKMSGFSSAPYLLKPRFFYSFDFSDDVVKMQVSDVSEDIKWIPKTNTLYYKKLASSGIKTNAEKPVLAFHYTLGIHKEWRTDEKCNPVDTPFDNPFPATKSCLYILAEFIRQLKENNIYDNTAILVCSDHSGNDARYTTPYDMTIMIKPFNSNQKELVVDDSKVRGIDILPTLLNFCCGDKADYKDFDGFSTFHVPAERKSMVYQLGHVDGFPEPDPDLARCYPGRNSIDEYEFVDVKSFSYKESFVRHIPLVVDPSSEEKK